MLEKIGLPAKPSLRGNNWVIDASHCQGCSSQFTFINRKHHCRRCGGIFCGSCTQQRMFLRGQGDSPVRICEPCKKLEEAARFEMRHGHKSRGGSKLTSKNEDEVLNQILGTDGKQSSLSGQESAISELRRGSSSASSSAIQKETLDIDGEGEILRSLSVGMGSHASDEMSSTTPDELRQQAVEEKKKYRILKGEGKPDEALKAFKRGKELERQAGALEIALRKSRRNVVPSSNVTGMKKKGDDSDAPGKRSKLLSQEGEEEKDDLSAELKKLGWSDADLHDAEKKPKKMTLEGELSNLISEVHQKSGSSKGISSIDKSQVIAHKRKAIMLKREGKLAEAKEELKRAKVLEKELEEQELLGGAEDSDDELSALIRSMDADKSDDLLMQYENDPLFNFQPLVNVSDDYGLDGNVDVMDEDMHDPDIALALKSLGWTEESDISAETASKTVPMDKKALQKEILSLKREALNLKRAGNTAEAMEQLKKAKLLERDLESVEENASMPSPEKSAKLTDVSQGSLGNMDSKLPPKSKQTIQRELLALKKKALTLRREGRLDEAEEELKKGSVLERQLQDMENASTAKAVNLVSKDSGLVNGDLDVTETLSSGVEGDEGEVTEQDMQDPALLSLLSNLGWKDEDIEQASVVSKPKQTRGHTENVVASVVTGAPPIAVGARRSKAEIQKELLALKRKALALRRQGESEEAEEVLNRTKVLEAQIAEMDAPKKETLTTVDSQFGGLGSLVSLRNDGNTESVEDLRKAEPELAIKESKEIADATLRSSVVSVSNRHQPIEENKTPLLENLIDLGDERITERAGYIPQSVNLLDLPTGVSSRRFEIRTEDVSGQDIHAVNGRTLNNELGRKEDNLFEKQEKEASLNKNLPTHEANNASESQSYNDQISLKKKILAHKRTAVGLKREGKLAEAREELIQAKLLEKNLNVDPQSRASPSSESVSISKNDSSVGQEEQKTKTLPPKQMSSRDRFKLQQESLGHKRQAMKLRREGRMDEAEAEFELAKALESQLEEQTAQDLNSSRKSEALDDVGVEDLLDPQLLSALRAIGIQDAETVSKPPERSEVAKLSVEKGENSSSQERSQLEEKIKAEKVKALNLKRAGKQAEALDALRRAKQYEKMLSSLAS